jgi:hypothetical protein
MLWQRTVKESFWRSTLSQQRPPESFWKRLLRQPRAKESFGRLSFLLPGQQKDFYYRRFRFSDEMDMRLGLDSLSTGSATFGWSPAIVRGPNEKPASENPAERTVPKLSRALPIP